MTTNNNHRRPLPTLLAVLALIACAMSTASAVSAAPSDKAAAKARSSAKAKEAGKQHRRATASQPAQSANTQSVSVDLNTATAAQLQALPGVGKTKAQRIVDWRTAHGRFERIKDLRRVKGFGARTVDRLRPHLSLTGASSEAAAGSKKARAKRRN